MPGAEELIDVQAAPRSLPYEPALDDALLRRHTPEVLVDLWVEPRDAVKRVTPVAAVTRT